MTRRVKSREPTRRVPPHLLVEEQVGWGPRLGTYPSAISPQDDLSSQLLPSIEEEV